jgi:hypothetical protein
MEMKMIRLRNLLIVWFGAILVLAACTSTEGDLTAESAEDAEIGEEIVMETAASTSSAQDVSTNSAQAVPTSTEQPMPPTHTPTAPAKADLPNLGPAPEIENEVWLNTDAPVTLASQRGKVVLVEFWTFG